MAGFSLSLRVYIGAKDTPGGTTSLVLQLTAGFESFIWGSCGSKLNNSLQTAETSSIAVLEPSCPFHPQVCVNVPNRQAPKSSCWSMGILKGRLIEDERWASQLCDLMAYLFCLGPLLGRQNKMRVRRPEGLQCLKEIPLVLARQQKNNVQVLVEFIVLQSVGCKQESIHTHCSKTYCKLPAEAAFLGIKIVSKREFLQRRHLVL